MQTQPNLISMIVTLKLASLPADEQPALPVWWGRAVHALLLTVIDSQDAAYAKKLHDPASGMRPFTSSTLLGFSKRKGLVPDQEYRIRLTGVEEHLVECLTQAAEPDGMLAIGSHVELNYRPFAVQSVSVDKTERAWAGLTNYIDLNRTYLAAERKPPKRITLQFSSPTAFKTGESGDIVLPVPLPEMVFNNLLGRWNAFASITFPKEVRRYARECLAISRYELKSRSIPGKDSSLRIGGVGRITYTAVHYDPYWMGMVCTLAEFAQFAGVGAGTSMGLGQCRWNDEYK